MCRNLYRIPGYSSIYNKFTLISDLHPFALNNATLPYIILLEEKGYGQACRENPAFLAGLNICNGVVTHEPVVKAITRVPATEALQA